MNSDLLATVNALGYLEEDTYHKEPDCLDTVKCLIKYLHQEDNNHDIRQQLGSGHVVENDLLPLLKQYSDDKALFGAVLRLLINLTQPALLCYGNHEPTETEQYKTYLDILSHNQSYRENFSNEETWKVLAQKVYDILEMEWEDRLPEDSVTVERILILCRNLLHVPATSKDNSKTLDDVSSHDRLLLAMHGAGIDSMILYIASSTSEQQWCLHVAEIISLMLKEQSVDALTAIGNEQERDRLGNELQSLRQQEEKTRQMRKLQQSSRHSRFGGTYVAKGKSALSDNNELVLHKALYKCKNVSYDEGKNKLRKAKNKRPLIDTTVKRRSTFAVRCVLKEFCSGLLENGYNHIMYSVRDRLARESSDDHDETYYFSIMKFLMEFNRKSKGHIEMISETLQLSTLHFIDTNIMKCTDLMLSDKKETASWGRRMHYPLRCYMEFLLTLHYMQTSGGPAMIESAKVLFNNIFYMVEYREVFLILLKKYDEHKQTHSFLEDLVQATHLFIRLFEKYCKGRTVVVEKKVVQKSRKKKTQKRSTQSQLPGASSEVNKANCWTEIEENLINVLQNTELPEPSDHSTMFDPTSEIPEEEQQQRALVRIQKRLQEKNVVEAVVLMRQARELWPEVNIFGRADASLEENVSTLKEICLADLAEFSIENEQEIDAEQEEEEEEEARRYSSREVQFSFDDFLKKFADYRVIQPYALLLKKFDSNSATINHCIAKMLHRVGYDLKMYGLLFQASLFRVFQKIFRYSKVNPAMKELEQLGKYIVGKFFETLPENPKLVTELLFWKQTVSEVYELKEGYGSFGSGKTSKASTWSEEEIIELTQLYEECKDNPSDIIDNIMTKITDDSRTRRQIMHQLLIQGLVTDAAELKRKKGTRTVIWREEEEMELRNLFEEYRNSGDPIGNIMLMLTSKKSKPKIVEKLMSLGLITDRKEVYKRRKNAANSDKNKKSIEPMHIGVDEDEDSNQLNEPQEPEEDLNSEDDDWTLIDLPSCIREICKDGLEENLAWVKSCLEQAVDDRVNLPEDEEIQPVPLVPLNEEQEDAMQNRAFKNLLRFVGIHKPASEQEMFWRVPDNLSINELQDSLRSLSQPFKRKRDFASGEERLDVPYQSDKDELNHFKRKKTAASMNDADEEDDFEPSIKKHRRITSLEDSDDENEISPMSSDFKQKSSGDDVLSAHLDAENEDLRPVNTINIDVRQNKESDISDDDEAQTLSVSTKNRRRILMDEDDDDED